jgi:hypothetical protein
LPRCTCMVRPTWFSGRDQPAKTILRRGQGTKQSVCTALTLAIPLVLGRPKRRAAPRRCARECVAFVKYVTMCVRNATHARLRRTAQAGEEPEVERSLV